MSRTRARRARDDGSASIWVLACAALVLVAASVIVLRTAAVLARHRADGAADSAALAAATQIGLTDAICPAAGRIASANGARLLSCAVLLDPDGRSGTVEVEVGLDLELPLLGGQLVHASARAGRLPAP